MSFVSILKKIGSALIGAEHLGAVVAEVAFPQFAAPIAALDGLVLKIQSSIITTEANNPTDGQGGIKAAAVTTDAQSYIAAMQAGLAIAGKTLSYDPQALQDSINAQVAAYNAFAKLKASFAITDAPKAP